MLGLTRQASPLALRTVSAGSLQVLVQALGFLAGIIVVRILTPGEYAYYTIANTTLGAMTVLADSGVHSAVLAQGGKVWNERARLGAVLAAGFELRKKFAAIAALISLPISCWLFVRHGAGWGVATLLAVSILPPFALSVTGQLLAAVPRLHQDLVPMQRVEILANGARVALLGALLPVWPWAASTILLGVLPQAWANWRWRHLAEKYADWHQPGDPDARAQIVTQVRRTLPSSIYYTLSGQLTIWLIAIFGQTASVADVGALSRLAVALGLIGTIFGVLAVPSFARIPAAEPRRLGLRYWQSQALLLAACAPPLVAVAAFPQLVVAILGRSYTGLEHEALLMAANGVASIMAGAAFGLGAARAVVAPPWAVIPYCVLVQIVLVYLLPVGTVSGVIWLGLLSSASQWILHVGYFAYVARAKRLP